MNFEFSLCVLCVSVVKIPVSIDREIDAVRLTVCSRHFSDSHPKNVSEIW